MELLRGMEIGLTPTRSARWPAARKFVGFLSQIPPIGPVLPTWPAYKPFAVNILVFVSFHGMEEVTGSIPVRSTNNPLHTNGLPNRFACGNRSRRC